MVVFHFDLLFSPYFLFTVKHFRAIFIIINKIQKVTITQHHNIAILDPTRHFHLSSSSSRAVQYLLLRPLRGPPDFFQQVAHLQTPHLVTHPLQLGGQTVKVSHFYLRPAFWRQGQEVVVVVAIVVVAVVVVVVVVELGGEVDGEYALGEGGDASKLPVTKRNHLYFQIYLYGCVAITQYRKTPTCSWKWSVCAAWGLCRGTSTVWTGAPDPACHPSPPPELGSSPK